MSVVVWVVDPILLYFFYINTANEWTPDNASRRLGCGVFFYFFLFLLLTIFWLVVVVVSYHTQQQTPIVNTSKPPPTNEHNSGPNDVCCRLGCGVFF